jgi:hypothetical protein
MSGILREELGVALSGVKANVAGYKLWQSTSEDVFLFTRAQPALARGDNGRYQVAVTTHRQQVPDRGLAITGGSAIFTVTSAVDYDATKFEQMTQAFQAGVVGAGAPDRKYKFVPLNTRKGMAQVLIDPASGTQLESFNGKDVGTPGGTMSFLVQLTETGAQEWAQGVRERSHIPAGVKYQYEYLTYVPPCGATVTLHGQRVFEHLSAALDASVQFGGFYGASAKLAAEWENMTRNGGIEVEFVGTGLSPELEKIRMDLTTTFADQAREKWFSLLFEPAPKVEEAKPGTTSGVYGGANFALKWKKASEAIDVSQTITLKGWSWLTMSADADISTMFADLDDQYLTEVNTEATFPVSMTVDSDPLFEHAALSLTFSEGRWPDTKVYGGSGGTDVYNLTSDHPNDIEVGYTANVDFTPPDWPVITATGKATIAEGGNAQVIKPSSWVGRHMIYLFVRDGDVVKPPSDEDYVIVNVSYSGDHLTRPVKASARLTALQPVEFSYPLDPAGATGRPKFSAFGVIGNRMVRTAEQPINLDEEAVFILASPTEIKPVSQAAALGEDTDPLASQLLAGAARPVYGRRVEEAGSGPLTEEPDPEPTGEPEPTGNGHAPAVLDGTTIALELESGANALIVRRDDGRRTLVPLAAGMSTDPLDDGSRRVHIELDDQHRARKVVVQLT